MPLRIVGGVTPITTAPMGMDKYGDSTVISEDGGPAAVTLTGWSARSGFPNTVITGDALVAQGPGTVTVRCRVQLAANWTATSRYLRLLLMQNNTQVASADFAVGAAALTLGDTALTLASGDRIWVRMATTDERGVTVQSGSNTYLYYDA
ncbi:hypothetical protein ACIA8C_11690 [Nocardia sp. NPDC051321]|uniref:hypothetical protein n=1 Tax=Nocardia sp. NPDC051321 TaxID=3364323 RepID=UPI0037A99AF6